MRQRDIGKLDRPMTRSTRELTAVVQRFFDRAKDGLAIKERNSQIVIESVRSGKQHAAPRRTTRAPRHHKLHF
jgi:hypothetical protein